MKWWIVAGLICLSSVSVLAQESLCDSDACTISPAVVGLSLDTVSETVVPPVSWSVLPENGRSPVSASGWPGGHLDAPGGGVHARLTPVYIGGSSGWRRVAGRPEHSGCHWARSLPGIVN